MTVRTTVITILILRCDNRRNPTDKFPWSHFITGNLKAADSALSKGSRKNFGIHCNFPAVILFSKKPMDILKMQKDMCKQPASPFPIEQEFDSDAVFESKQEFSNMMIQYEIDGPFQICDFQMLLGALSHPRQSCSSQCRALKQLESEGSQAGLMRVTGKSIVC